MPEELWHATLFVVSLAGVEKLQRTNGPQLHGYHSSVEAEIELFELARQSCFELALRGDDAPCVAVTSAALS